MKTCIGNHRHLPVAALAAALLLIPAPGQAQGDEADSPWAVGFQSSYPAYGISVRYDLSEKLVAQGILSTGTISGVTGRGNYELQENPKYDIFGYGSVTLWYWSGSGTFDPEAAVGFGAGGGVELDWPEIFDDPEFPPLFSTIELGFGTAGFTNYSFSALTIGGSIHYHF